VGAQGRARGALQQGRPREQRLVARRRREDLAQAPSTDTRAALSSGSASAVRAWRGARPTDSTSSSSIHPRRMAR
jgi:hypothetical protein